MIPTPIIDMFSGTGELAPAVSTALIEPARPVSFSDTYGPARKYLKYRFPGVEVCKDFCDQIVSEGSIVTIGAPRQDLSVAGKRAGAEHGSGPRSSLIHEALDMAVAGGADLIVAENAPDGHSTYLALADRLAKKHGYRTTVSSAGAWEVGAPHRRERIMLVAARRHFETHHVNVIRRAAPAYLLPTPSVVDRAWGLTPEQWDDVKRRYREKHRNGLGETISSVLSRDLEDEEIRLIQTWETVTGVYAPPTGQTCQFMHWLMGLRPRLPDALGLSVSAQRRLAGNAVVGLQARLMLQRGLTATNDTKGNL